MNILILSAGTRNKVVEAFRETLAQDAAERPGGGGRVIATDASGLAPALYAADAAYVVPRIDAPGYIDRILEICRKEQITGLFSLIDPELSLIAKERERFGEIGVTPVVSSYALCEASLDKERMAHIFREQGLRTAQNYLTYEDYERAAAAGDPGTALPVFVKPRHGSASIGINFIPDSTLLRALCATDGDLMIQSCMHGQEYGADVYIDLISGRCTQIFLKKKIKMRAGETDKSVSVKNPALFRTIAAFVERAGFRGMIDIDLFLNPDGVWYFSEVNPRFGGGYPHAYACGVNFPRAVLHNLRGEENPVTIGDYEEGVCMMKYNELCIRKEEALAS
ncbi:MAG: ATP-grasp domain-containing protein [Butyrivibrio sp.]|nr:ATP-grasp domain-containing protein [Butyrivibrio sp.]